MTPKKLPQEIVNVLLPRLSDEYAAHYFYRSASNYCANVGFEKAAAHFKSESEDELKHAHGIEDFLTGWNVTPNLPDIEKPVLSFEGLVDIIEQSYVIEYALYENYEKDSVSVMTKDVCTFDFLKTYRDIQVSSVKEYSDLLNELALINPANKLDLYLFEKNAF